MKRITLFYALLIAHATPATAEYYAAGDIYGYSYNAVGKVLPHFGKLSAEKIYAIKHSDGKIFNKVRRVYHNSEISLTPQNECVFRPRHNDPIYLGRHSDGSYNELKVGYIKFECVKR